MQLKASDVSAFNFSEENSIIDKVVTLLNICPCSLSDILIIFNISKIQSLSEVGEEMFVIQTGGSLIPSYDIQCRLNISQTTTLSNSGNGKYKK